MRARLTLYTAPLIALLVSSACTTTERIERSAHHLSGAELYENLCASCHGVDGKGHGPVAPLIKIGVPDLTRITWREGGEFPEEDVHRTIDGRLERPAHGPRDMPVWGWQFYDSASSDASAERTQVDATIMRLVEYVRSIQQE